MEESQQFQDVSRAVSKLEDEAAQLIIILWDVKKSLDKLCTLLMVLIGTSGIGLAPSFVKNVSEIEISHDRTEYATPAPDENAVSALEQSRKARPPESRRTQQAP